MQDYPYAFLLCPTDGFVYGSDRARLKEEESMLIWRRGVKEIEGIVDTNKEMVNMLSRFT